MITVIIMVYDDDDDNDDYDAGDIGYGDHDYSMTVMMLMMIKPVCLSEAVKPARSE